MTQPRPLTSPTRVRLAVVLILIVSTALLVAAALHVAATTEARHAQEKVSLATRAESARRAAALEPWNQEFVRRARILQLWADGQQLLDAGDYNDAYEALREAYAQDIGNSELLALFKSAQAAQALATNRKAHLQHGHEGPGGTLRPEDIER